MPPLETLARFLLPPDTRLVKEVGSNRVGFRYLLEKTTPFEVCPRCAHTSSSIKDHRLVKVRDAPMRGKDMVLIISKRRFRCRHCGHVFTEPIPGISKGSRTTQRFKNHVLWACENFQDLEKVKVASRCSTGFLYGALYEMLEHNRRKRLYPWPDTVGVDEHLFRRYKNGRFGWVTAIVDFKAPRLYELVEGKSADELKAALGEKSGRERVRFVVIDMSEGYRRFVKGFFPNAQLVVDKFHVLRLFSRALSRKRIDVTGDQRKSPIRALLLRNDKDLEDHERRALWVFLNTHADIRELYEYKEAMHRLYRMKGAGRAGIVFKALLDRMGRSKLKAAQRIRTTLMSWRREIKAYFVTGLTNARTEGFNNKAKLLQRRAFGYRSFEHYRLRLLNACA